MKFDRSNFNIDVFRVYLSERISLDTEGRLEIQKFISLNMNVEYQSSPIYSIKKFLQK